MDQVACQGMSWQEKQAVIQYSHSIIISMIMAVFQKIGKEADPYDMTCHDRACNGILWFIIIQNINRAEQ